jgi:hypothetical protein
MTGFANNWDPDIAAEFYPTWIARNYISGTLLEVDELVRVVDFIARGGAGTSIPSVTVTPRPAA